MYIINDILKPKKKIKRYFQNGFQDGRQYFKTSITYLLHGILLESLVCPDMWLESWLDYNTANMFISESNISPNIVFMQLKQI